MSIKNTLLKSKIVRHMLNQRISFMQYQRNKETLSQLHKLKNSHMGERCFIIGTGPSLRMEDLERLKNEITFGPNRIYELFPKIEWRPTYYVNQDHTLIKEFSDEIKKIDVNLVFLPIDYKDQFIGDKYRFFVLKHKEFYPKDAPFSKDIAKYIAQGFTVIYGAIQIAVYMGFKEIYLIGVDHNYNQVRDSQGKIVRMDSKSKNYADGMKELINPQNLPRVEETTIAFETAEKISKKIGVKIYNATRGGKLEAFERIDFDKVLGGKQL